MKSWKRSLTESLLIGSAIAIVIVLIARQQITAVLDLISPVFYAPMQGAALLSGDGREPPPWLFHSVLALQCIVVVFAVGWLAGRYRGHQAKA